MNYTNGEKNLYDWQYGVAGSFIKGLFEIISRADSKNFKKLITVYPDECRAYNNYRHTKNILTSFSEDALGFF